MIRVSSGAVEDTYPITITDKNGNDLSTASIAMSLGDDSNPGATWYAATINVQGATVADRVVQLEIGSGLRPDRGTWRVWWKLTLGSTVVIRAADLAVQIA